MTHRSQKHLVNAPAVRLLRGMEETFCWFDDALNRFQRELVALPQLTQRLSTRDSYPINISERLDKIKSEIRTFESDLRRSGRVWEVNRDCTNITSTDLPPSERSALQTINQHFVTVTDKIQDAATAIAETLDARVADHADVIWDYEMDATCHFVLRQDDPGFAQNSDNFLASRELFIQPFADSDAEQWKFIGCDWPEGFADDPMPHGLLFHELHHDRSTFGVSPRQSLEEIQRIGDVWVDLIVKFQFYFDVVQGKWVKALHTRGEDNIRVYAQELQTR
jgi:hypothetical protein